MLRNFPWEQMSTVPNATRGNKDKDTTCEDAFQVKEGFDCSQLFNRGTTDHDDDEQAAA